MPLWQSYLAIGALLTAAYLFVPPFVASGPLMNLLGLSPVIAIVIGIRRYKPASPGAWWCFAAGFALFWLGDLYTYSYPRVFGADVPFPSAGDAIYLTVYPALMAGLFVLVRRRNPQSDRAGLIDSLIMTLGLSVISWVVLIDPTLHDAELAILAKLVSIAYPLGDVLLLAAAIRLAVDLGRRAPAFYLMSSSIVALLVTDFAYGAVTLQGAYDGQTWLDVGWIAFYLLWGAAALHPSMVALERPAPDREPRLRPIRLVLLTLASIIAPILALLRNANLTNDAVVLNLTAIVLFALVVARIAGLVRQQERSVARERILRSVGEALVAATDRNAIHDAALEAARALTAHGSVARLCAADDHAELAAAAGAGPVELTAAARSGLDLPAACTHGDVLALSTRGETLGLLIVATAGPHRRTVHRTLEALAAQVSLALESNALTVEVHRRTSEARFASLVQHSSDLITVIDADAGIVYQSPSIEHVLGHRPDDVIGRAFGELVVPADLDRVERLLADGADAQSIECRLQHQDGGTRQFEILATNLIDDEHVRGIVLNGRDVTERNAFEEQLTHQAFHDPVTGLANRALFVERVRHAVARARREEHGLAVIFMDLDDFKTVNDSLGHAAGDQVLVGVAQRLAASVRPSDTAARFGGDEFAVLLEDIGSPQEAADTAERILGSLTEPLSVDGKEVVVATSLGISVAAGAPTADADELIRNADAAMYIAKRGGGGYRLFEPEMHKGVLERLELRADLQRAIASDQLELHFQPVVRLEDAGVVGLEALVRWRRPGRGLVAPDQFIPLAEEMGLIVPLGAWVLLEACRQAVAFRGDGGVLYMSVNISMKQLQLGDIVADVRDALQESGLDPGSLVLEITETAMMSDTDLAVRRLEELKALGVRLALDDFGTGYSSLSYLSRLPVGVLKMDRSFLRDGATLDGLATAVVALGKTLNLQVVAEGIELKEQWHALRDLGCTFGQGFYFARPMDTAATLEYLRLVSPPLTPTRAPAASR